MIHFFQILGGNFITASWADCSKEVNEWDNCFPCWIGTQTFITLMPLGGQWMTLRSWRVNVILEKRKLESLCNGRTVWSWQAIAKSRWGKGRGSPWVLRTPWSVVTVRFSFPGLPCSSERADGQDKWTLNGCFHVRITIFILSIEWWWSFVLF